MFYSSILVSLNHKFPTPSTYPTCGGISATNRQDGTKTLELQVTPNLLSLFIHVDDHDQTFEFQVTLQNE